MKISSYSVYLYDRQHSEYHLLPSDMVEKQQADIAAQRVQSKQTHNLREITKD